MSGPRSRALVFDNREFTGLLGSKAVSVLGDQLARIALTILVFDRTRSAGLAALTYTLTLLPVIVGGPLLGGLADRTPPRRLLVATDLARAALFAVMAVPGVPTAVLLVLLTVATVVETPWAATRQPLLRAVLTDGSGGDAAYQRGSGLDETLEQLGQVAGFALGGLLLVVVDPRVALLVDAASFLVSAAAVRVLVAERPVAAGRHEGVGAAMVTAGGRVRRAVGDVRTGWSTALGPRTRRPLLLTWVGVGASIAPDAVATPWAAHLHHGPAAVGAIYAASAVGAVLALPLVARAGERLSGRLLVPLAALSLLPLLVAAADPGLPLVLAALVLSGMGGTSSLLARVAFARGLDGSPQARGRAFAVAAAGVTAAQGLGAGVTGLVATVLSPPAAVTVVAVVGLLTGALVVTGTKDDAVPGPVSATPVMLA